MKKISSLLIIFCFIATSISYAQFFRDKPDNDNSSGSNSAVHDSNTGRTVVVTETNDEYGGFFRSSNADSPGGRPGNGDAIGQEAPLKDGLPVLIGCCILLVVVKTIKDKKKKK